MKAQRILRGVCVELRQLDDWLAQLCETLPEPVETFNALAELRVAIECVRSDLLHDALSTLKTAATRGEAEMRRAFERRTELRAGG